MKKLLLLSLLCCSQVFAQDIDVQHYDIHLDLVKLNQKQLGGYSEARIKAINNINSVSLDLLRLTVDSVWVDGSKKAFSYNDSIVRVDGLAFAANNEFKVRVYYHGTPFKDPSTYGGGFYITNDFAYNVGVGFSADPHNLGRTWFAGVDNFTDRASYSFHIHTDLGKKAFCGGTLDSVTYTLIGEPVWHWNLEENIPTYLASVAVAAYSTITDTYAGMNGPIPVAINTLKADSTKAVGSYAHLEDAFHIYEQRFGPYRWPRVGFNSVPTIGGAMEHATNIAIASQLIDGGLGYESTIAHELSHHWFGDLVTCENADQMWLNEGWAVFCEYIFQEGLYGKTAYRDYVRKKHFDVLKSAHVNDKGYYPVGNVPHNITYGTTVYEKGGLVANTLRHYIGDSLFFAGVKSYLNKYAYNDGSSEKLKNELAAISGKNLDDFFAGWVASPGFPQFSVEQIVNSNIGTIGDSTMSTITISQKQKGSSHIWKDNRIELTLVDANGKQENIVMNQSEGSSTQSFRFKNFSPVCALIDLDEKIADATTEYWKTIKSTGAFALTNTFLTVDVKQVPDSAQLLFYHHWVAPDPYKNPSPDKVITSGHYWKIDGLMPASFLAKTTFQYQPDFDKNLTSSEDKLFLLYRPNSQSDWSIVPNTSLSTGSNKSDFRGTISTDTLRKGEYTIGGYSSSSGINNSENERLLIYPNPADKTVTVKWHSDKKGVLTLVNLSGAIVWQRNVERNQNEIAIERNNLPAGVYTLRLTNSGNEVKTALVNFY